MNTVGGGFLGECEGKKLGRAFVLSKMGAGERSDDEARSLLKLSAEDSE